MTTNTAPDIQSIPNTGDRSPDAILQTLDDAPVALSTLWSGARTGLALVFLRHYGCSFCMEHVRDIERHGAEFTEAGVTVALVGCGSVDEAARFRDKLGLAVPLYNDRERVAYRAYGLAEASVATIVNPKVIAGGIRAIGKGYLPRRSSGNPRQLQGQFLIDRQGIIRAVSRPSLMSEISSVDALLDAASDLR